MIQALMAVFTASLLGSIHCVGMCGPFVLIATRPTLSPTEPNTHNFYQWVPLASYHLGRLVTYLALGLLVGSIASAGQGIAGQWGIGQATSIVLGSTLVLLGFVKVWKLAFKNQAMIVHSTLFLRWSEMIARLRRKTQTQSRVTNAFLWGLLSTWLPCGWLYLFALASATAGSVYSSLLMMGAFWLGTLPALSVVAWGGSWFAKIQPNALQWFAACLLIGLGFWTLTSRAWVDLSSLAPENHRVLMDDPSDVSSIIESIETTPLPCCSEADSLDANKVK